MQYGVWHIDRRDSADRDEFAKAAVVFCRAMRGLDGVADCRFYWKPFDTIVILAEAESADAWNAQSNELAEASFALFDLGRSAGYETWLDARSAEEAYLSAQ